MHVNIPQGHQVPLSGKYKCEWCGTLTVVGGMGRAEDVFIAQLAAENARANPTMRWFKEGAFFDQCARCRDATGWTLLEEGEPKSWWQFWK